MTKRFMADSVKTSVIPDEIRIGNVTFPVDLKAGYINGKYVHDEPVDVTIDVTGSRPDADVLDVEAGDASPSQAPKWAKDHKALHHGEAGTIYVNRDNVHSVFNAMESAGLRVGVDFCTWIATLDGTDHVPDMTGVRAIQLYGERQTDLNVDLSIVYDDGWKVSSADKLPGVWKAIISADPHLVVGIGTDDCIWAVMKGISGTWGPRPFKIAPEVVLRES
jgi:hypothetical protein